MVSAISNMGGHTHETLERSPAARDAVVETADEASAPRVCKALIAPPPP